jgi:hypothetical protein
MEQEKRVRRVSTEEVPEALYYPQQESIRKGLLEWRCKYPRGKACRIVWNPILNRGSECVDVQDFAANPSAQPQQFMPLYIWIRFQRVTLEVEAGVCPVFVVIPILLHRGLLGRL